METRNEFLASTHKYKDRQLYIVLENLLQHAFDGTKINSPKENACNIIFNNLVCVSLCRLSRDFRHMVEEIFRRNSNFRNLPYHPDTFFVPIVIGFVIALWQQYTITKHSKLETIFESRVWTTHTGDSALFFRSSSLIP